MGMLRPGDGLGAFSRLLSLYDAIPIWRTMEERKA
jgi:hypothetical protein